MSAPARGRSRARISVSTPFRRRDGHASQADEEVFHITVLTGLLILVAVLVAAALAVLGTLAAAAEIFPSWFGWGDEAVSATVSAPGPQPRRGDRSEATRA
jgi:hypothetical protein